MTLSADAKKTIKNLADSVDENTRLYYATTLKGMEFIYTNSDYNDQLKAALFAKGGEYEITKETHGGLPEGQRDGRPSTSCC